MKRTALVICLAAIMLLALAVPVFADTSGTVYGKAVLAPYAIVISGGGTDSNNPLTYQGNLGQDVGELYDNRVTVQNVGTQNARIRLDVNQLPTGGSDQWNLSDFSAPGPAAWFFSDGTGYHSAFAVPTSDPDYAWNSTLNNSLAAGDSNTYYTRFIFPTSSNSSEDHYMSATISAVAPY
jgi:hypothetical protein